MDKLPELLIPAGSLEKLKVAVDYGADAVYLAGQNFGLRAAADNFTETELRAGIQYAHQNDVKVYVVLNGFLHDDDLQGLPSFVDLLEELAVDAVIVSDLGVIETVKKHSRLEIHLSTQASCLNSYSAKLWKDFGVKRIVLGREVSIAEAQQIKNTCDIEVEMFIHGSMCMAYSGNCTISNFTQGRDSNRGGCAHSCRFEYKLTHNQVSANSHFMSSTDLNGLALLEQFIKAGIDSVKVEGRMKSHLYAATVAKVYKEALQSYREYGELPVDLLLNWEEELKKFSHRSYAAANLMNKAGRETIFDERVHDQNNKFAMVGRVLESSDSDFVMQVRSAFNQGESLEILNVDGPVQNVQVDEILNLKGESIKRTKPSTLVRIPFKGIINKNAIVRSGVCKL